MTLRPSGCLWLCAATRSPPPGHVCVCACACLQVVLTSRDFDAWYDSARRTIFEMSQASGRWAREWACAGEGRVCVRACGGAIAANRGMQVHPCMFAHSGQQQLIYPEPHTHTLCQLSCTYVTSAALLIFGT